MKFGVFNCIIANVLRILQFSIQLTNENIV